LVRNGKLGNRVDAIVMMSNSRSAGEAQIQTGQWRKK
jgi:hypothetical protein